MDGRTTRCGRISGKRRPPCLRWVKRGPGRAISICSHVRYATKSDDRLLIAIRRDVPRADIGREQVSRAGLKGTLPSRQRVPGLLSAID
jgi:hypothetical protein